MSDPASIAKAQREFWNGEATRRWVVEQKRIDRLMFDVTDAALAAAAPKPGESILDVGCGTGTTTLRLADAVGPSGHVLGVDISEQQLGLARQRVAAAGATQVQLVLDDAATHDFARQSFDLGFTRFGVMFFADPVGCVPQHQKRDEGERTAAADCLPVRIGEPVGDRKRRSDPSSRAASPDIGTGGAGPVQLERSSTRQAYSYGAGFGNVVLTPLDLPFNLGADAVEAAEFATFIGQGARLLHGQPDETWQAARVAFEAFFKQHEGPTGVSLPGALWLVSARV